MGLVSDWGSDVCSFFFFKKKLDAGLVRGLGLSRVLCVFHCNEALRLPAGGRQQAGEEIHGNAVGGRGRVQAGRAVVEGDCAARGATEQGDESQNGKGFNGTGSAWLQAQAPLRGSRPMAWRAIQSLSGPERPKPL